MASRSVQEKKFDGVPEIGIAGQDERNESRRRALAAVDETDLTPDEAETWGSIMRGEHRGLRARDLSPWRSATSGIGDIRRTGMAAKRKAAVKGSARKVAREKAARRELIDTGSNKLFVRRNARGTSFTEVEDVGRSLAADRRRKARAVAKPGQGDRGDHAEA